MCFLPEKMADKGRCARGLASAFLPDMEKPLLNDPDIKPDADVLEKALERARAACETLTASADAAGAGNELELYSLRHWHIRTEALSH
jgi:hypothetical protein